MIEQAEAPRRDRLEDFAGNDIAHACGNAARSSAALILECYSLSARGEE
jgi:hypothetical protein